MKLLKKEIIFCSDCPSLLGNEIYSVCHKTFTEITHLLEIPLDCPLPDKKENTKTSYNKG